MELKVHPATVTGQPRDEIRDNFLASQWREAAELARDSDIVKIAALEGTPPTRFLVELRCRGLAMGANGVPEPWHVFAFGLWFPPDYLSATYKASDIVTLLHPPTCFHPNVRFPFVCLGRMSAGTTLSDILYQLYEIVSWQRVTMNENDALNWA